MANFDKQTVDGIEFHTVDNDMSGNPRYVFHFLNLADNYAGARRLARILGARPYRAKWYSGGFVIQSFNLKDDAFNTRALKFHQTLKSA